jgi:hypothetical protein
MFFVFLSEEALDLEFTEKLLHNQESQLVVLDNIF